MPINWKKASPEQIHARNEKRRQRYATLDLDQKNLIRAHESVKSQARRSSSVSTQDESLTKRWARLASWDEKTILPPHMYKDMYSTTEFYKVRDHYNKACTNCGTWTFDQLWKFAPKNDPIKFLPHQLAVYKRILRYPNEYDMLCTGCAYYRRMQTIIWIFTDSPMYSTGEFVQSKELIEAAYPRDPKELIKKIRSGAIKAIMCGATRRINPLILTPEMRERREWMAQDPGYIKISPIYNNIRNSQRHIMDEATWFTNDPKSSPSLPPREKSPIELAYF
jgi:hypothetical protein